MGGSPKASLTASGRGNQPAGETTGVQPRLPGPLSREIDTNVLTEAVMMFAAADPQESTSRKTFSEPQQFL